MNSSSEMRITQSGSASPWRVISSFAKEQHYISRNWDYECGERLVLSQNSRIVEASVFRHSLRGLPVKTVVELPTSFGCQMRCPHCASGDIGVAVPLSAADLSGVYAAASACVEGPRLVSLSGIGECSLNERAVTTFAREIVGGTNELQFTFTTVGIRPEFVGSINSLAREVPVKLLQISLFHHDDAVVKTVMGRAFLRYDLAELMRHVIDADAIHVRFNIVLIRDFNDTAEAWGGLRRRLSGLEDRVSIRVSQLNETNVSRSNGLRPTTAGRVIDAANWFVREGFDAYAFMSSYNDDMNCGQLIWNYRQSQTSAA